MNTKLDAILGQLEKVRETDEGYQACCPAHDDKTPSLSITQGEDGTILLYCHAGCSIDDICGAMEMKTSELFPQKPMQVSRKIVDTYDYVDEQGQMLFQKLRYEPKGFSCKAPDKFGGWANKLTNVRKPLYNLANVIKSNELYVCEGEKDVETLRKHGYTATSNFDGAGKWNGSYNEFFRDKIVYLLPDNDEVGRKHVANIFKNINSIASKCRVVELPGLPESGDVSDFFMNGGTVDSFNQICSDAPEGLPDGWRLPALDIKKARLNDSLLKYARTDFGAGEAFVAIADDFLFDVRSEKWCQWTGKIWKINDKAARGVMVDKVARGIRKEALSLQGEARASAERYAMQLESTNKINNALREAQYAKSYENFDAETMVLNVNNGTIDLTTGELKPHSKDNHLTKICPVDYIPNAKSEVFDNFLDDCTGGDKELQRFLQIATGYSLTGRTDEEKLFFIHGPKASGKSTFIDAIKNILGDYAQIADFETFLKKQTGAIRNDIATLAGARFVASLEVDEGKSLAEGLIKTLTGGDTICARFLYKESFEFQPQFKLWLVANHKPIISDRDDAMWRRVLVVPFEHTVPNEKRDPKIKAFLRNPRQGGSAVLAWAVQGCLLWQKEGLQEPKAVIAATEQYQEEMNPLLDFITDRLEINPTAIVSVADLGTAYDEYCVDNCIKTILSTKEFNKRIESLGGERKLIWWKRKRRKCWIGVGLKNMDECSNDAGDSSMKESSGNL